MNGNWIRRATVAPMGDTRSKTASVLAVRRSLRERRVEPVPRLPDLASYLPCFSSARSTRSAEGMLVL